jgi:hypothetical protein
LIHFDSCANPILQLQNQRCIRLEHF